LNNQTLPSIFDFRNKVSKFIALTDKEKFKVYHIRKVKEDGSIKIRTIVSPSPEFKDFLTELKYFLEPLFPAYENSFAWHKGKTRFQCARMHLDSKYVKEIDIVKYFDYISKDHVLNLFENHGITNIHGVPVSIIANLITFDNKVSRLRSIPQGFPTSPLLANAVRYPIDLLIDSFCKENNLLYSVYGDNMIVSGNEFPKNFIVSIKEIVNSFGFYIKTSSMDAWGKKQVLGVNIKNKVSIPKKYVKSVYIETVKTIKENQKPSKSLLGKINVLKSIENKKNYNYLMNLLKRATNDQRS